MVFFEQIQASSYLFSNFRQNKAIIEEIMQ